MSAKQMYKFGQFVLDPEERLLLRDGEPVSLTPKAFDILLALAEKSGHLVRKDDLMRKVWPDAFVEEANLAQNISVIRRVLDSRHEQYIETVPKLGYRLIVQARMIGEPTEAIERASPLVAKDASKVATDLVPSAANNRSGKRTVAISLVIAVLAIAGLTLWVKTRAAKAVPVHITSLAVLPLENLSQDPEQEYFADGMTDELITDLAKIHALRKQVTACALRHN